MRARAAPEHARPCARPVPVLRTALNPPRALPASCGPASMIILRFDAPMDYGTSTFFLWNFAAVGMRVVFWPAPPIIRQVYLVIVSVLLAWSLTKLPEWTTWSILAAVSVWDLIAVLTPRGPLKGLVEESQRRNEPIPGLVYEGACPPPPERPVRAPRAHLARTPIPQPTTPSS